ncbi:alpha,alpha-trehalose-phosphate synthase (UDP-forming) [Diaphorobacter sp. HDW4B]|uniref:alpha,alpha-trehalose-phosphate synthase (UDP-forming) n=1 Tax=Diaphorobacter sp. HDW4B TaxID=2714925 RepID=UPI00140E54FD|nr:alpha,alpha-trehalose-phosphate synthase (UDP-forming) [Diaphorobacter sp. HDW4B]QIL70273.1 alpha,alpha-trehalose-phosphate synthase (UDP-forming) [Diaphorobacter sp. HDW4B]
MGRLVVVSNRLADPRKPAAGGLAVALGESLQKSGGLWFGWSGNISEDGASGNDSNLHMRNSGKVTLATVDLNRSAYESYYEGYSNSVLWPVFHYRLDLANFNTSHLAGYRRVNQLFARKLKPLLRDDDTIWVHDYHLIPLAAELRALGCRQRIGFFLHIPLPPALILAAIPQHEWLMRSLFAYDLVGLQSEADVAHCMHYMTTEAQATLQDDQRLSAFGATVQVKAFPIGIDVQEFQRLGRSQDAVDTFESVRNEYSRRQLLLGIDRLDYSKGIPQRVRAFRELLERYPDNVHSATLLMIASPSRDAVNAYVDLRQELEGLCGAINGDFGDLDWIPVRYIHRTVARKRVPGLCRASRVGLVTPLRDGMNLVAKEYVVAQDPEDPGVLVLSRFAGAAEQLRDALLVNPYDAQGMAESIQTALHMPLAERQRRHSALLENIQRYDIHWWREAFLATLQSSATKASAA